MIRMSIARPVAVSMAYMAVSLLGVAAWKNIPIELLPDTDLPRLQIRSQWRGSSPETVEAFVTSPLEAAIQQVGGVEKITSWSQEDRGVGVSRIEVEFDRDVDMDFVRLELSERLTALEQDLPVGLIGPTVEQYVPEEFRDQDQQFLWYTVTGPLTLEALRAHVDDVIAPEILQVDGVGEVIAYGGRDRLIELQFNEDQLAALGLSTEQLAQKIYGLEYITEAGAVRDDGKLRTLAIRQRAESASDIRDLIVASDRGRVIRVSDIAKVSDTFEDPESHYRINGMPAVSFRVTKEHLTNTVAVADRVKAKLASIESLNPPGVRLILDQDESEAIKKQLTDLRERALVAAVVIFAVLLLFLQSFRSAGIVFATIAFSILIALNLIYFGGLTLNVLTLMGLAMGFGLIVDNAIVVLENIYRLRRSGLSGPDAAARGAREVLLPILAATLTTLIVFIPFVYLQGELRVYYVPLAIVVGMSLLASLFVAFSFIPALASRIISGGQRRSSQPLGLEDPGMPQTVYARLYGGLVRVTARFPVLTVLAALGMFYGSWHRFDKYVNRGVLWGAFFGNDTSIRIIISLPRGAEMDETDRLASYFERKLSQTPEIEQYVTRVFENYARIDATFPKEVEQTQIPVAIKEQMVAYSYLFGGAEVRVYGYGPSFYGGGGSPPNYSIKILGYNYEEVREIAEGLKSRLERFSRVRDVDINAGGQFFFGDKATEVALRLNRERLAMYGLTVRDVVSQVRSAVGGRMGQGQTLRVGGEEVDFEVKLAGYRDLNVLDLAETLVAPANGGDRVRLGDVGTIVEEDVLGVILRENQQYQRTVRYEFRGPRKLGDRIRDAVVGATHLPDGYTIEDQQEWSWSSEEQTQIVMVLLVSLGLIFMVTAALFESIRQPIVVLLSVPMALIGVFLMFFFTEASFTREAYIGVIMMGGIVVNNAILLIDHINQLRRRDGVPLMDAVVRGTLERVRPILMTSATTVLGLTPLVIFSESVNANIWNALGYALIGGLLSSTFLVLTVTPALYVLFERGPERRRANAVIMEPAPAAS
jgi:hydrophobic/amphiphilic exporter-1 (mainly G- bacteria), HAE1 family